MPVNLDYAAGPPLDTTILEYYRKLKGKYSTSPFLAHSASKSVRNAIFDIRNRLAEHLGCEARQLFFTASGTQANAIIGQHLVFQRGIRHFFISAMEHQSILAPLKLWARQTAIKLHWIRHKANGAVDMEHLNAITQTRPPGCIILSHANYFTGNLLPVKTAGKIAQQNEKLFWCDMSQTAGLYPIGMQALPVDYAVVSAHKLRGVQGAGLLYIRNFQDPFWMFQPRTWEVSMHEHADIPALFAMEQALHKALSRCETMRASLQKLKNQLITELREVPGANAFSKAEEGLPSMQWIAFDPANYSKLLPMQLEQYGIQTGKFPEQPEYCRGIYARSLPETIKNMPGIRISMSSDTRAETITKLTNTLKLLAKSL